jgi:hypothetical protein
LITLLRIGRPSRIAAFADFGDVFGERPVRVVFADERDTEKIVVQVEVLELDTGKAEREQRGVERDDRGSEVAVDERVRAEHLDVEACGGVDGTH